MTTELNPGDITEETDFYICEFCTFSTNRLVTFTSHISKCAAKNPDCFTCSKCVYQSKEFDDFQEHCKSHISDDLFTCIVCSQIFSSQSDLDKHSTSCCKKQSFRNEKHDSSNDFDCQDCNFYCNSSEEFEKHMSAQHSTVWDYSCFHCTYRVKSYSLFSSHLSRYHPEVLATEDSDDDVPEKLDDTISCLYCDFSSNSQIDVHRHMETKHRKPDLLSTSCDNKRVKVEEAVKEPEVAEEEEVEFDEPLYPGQRRKRYICSDCPYKTNSNAAFARHRRSHQSSISYECNICQFKTSSIALVKRHVKHDHPGTNTHANSGSWKMIKTSSQVKNGQHLPLFDWKCDQCSYQCTNHLALRNHKKVHAPKSLSCDYCVFKTRNRYFMGKHMSKHHSAHALQGQYSKKMENVIKKEKEIDVSEEKEEKSQTCSPVKKEPRAAGSLTFKFFKCERCGFIARHQKNLEKHVKAHDAAFNYKCPHCLFINTCYKTFRMHMNKFHPREEILIKRDPLEKYQLHCDKCGYETNSSQKLEKHKVDHEEGRFLHCEICNYIAVSQIRLGKHMKLKHPQTHLKKCTQCDFTTNRTKRLKAHLLAHKDPNAHQCKICKFMTVNQRSFQTHMLGVHPEVPFDMESESPIKKEEEDNEDGDEKKVEAEESRQLYKCDKCMFSSNREAVLEVHLKCHDSPDCLKCDHCYFLTSHKYSLEKHLAEKHSIKKIYFCKRCPFTTKRNEFFRNHIKAHDSKYSYTCSGCAYLTIKYSSYTSHMKKEHPDNEILPEKKPGQTDSEEESDEDEEEEQEQEQEHEQGQENDSNGFQCELCNFTTIFPKSMEVHARAHESKKAIKCELCDYITLSPSSYKSHVKHNHPESKLKSELYKCNKCEYTTGSGTMYRSHQRAHTSDNKYTCKHCYYLTVFYHSICSHMTKYHPDELNDHVKFESPEGYQKKEEKQYNYYCRLCQFKCMYYKLYCNHLHQVHPSAKNEYQAEQVKKKQSRESDKLYFCKDCDFETDIAGEMEKHLSTHTPDQYFVCTLCSFKTTTDSEYHKHQTTQHQASPGSYKCEAVYICPCCAFKTGSVETYRIHLIAHPLKEKVTVEMKVVSKEVTPTRARSNIVYSCDLCEYTATNNKQFEYHVLAHQSEDAYHCDKCSFKTVNRQSFRKHVKVSHGIVLPPGAGGGGGGGGGSHHRRNHSSSDTSTTPCLPASRIRALKADEYRCVECGFESSSISAYNNHMGAHLAPNSLRCPHCLYRTVKWVNLKSHLCRTHPELRTSRDMIPGAKMADPAEQSPSRVYRGPSPVTASTPKSSYPAVDAFSALPVMLSRDGTSYLTEEVVTEEVVSEEVVSEEVVSEEVVSEEVVLTPDHHTTRYKSEEDEEISF